MSSRTITLLRTLVPALGVTVAFIVAGCNIVAPAYLLIHGPEKIQAVYELDANRTTVIFIDDPKNRIPRRALRMVAAQETERILLEDRALKDVVATQSAMAVSIQDRYGESFSVVEIGKAVKAEVVLYAVIDEFSLSQDGQSYSPIVTMRVRLIDVEKNERIWPLDETTGYLLTAPMRPTRALIPTAHAEMIEAQTLLAKHAGRALAQLFYDHERRLSARRGG